MAPLADESSQQRFIAYGIHEPGDALTVVINSPECGSGETRGPVRPGDLQAMLNVLVHFVPCQRRQMVANGDALTQLAQSRIVQLVAQFGLTHQDDLQQFPVVGFEIRKQADLLE